MSGGYNNVISRKELMKVEKEFTDVTGVIHRICLHLGFAATEEANLQVDKKFLLSVRDMKVSLLEKEDKISELARNRLSEMKINGEYRKYEKSRSTLL